MLDDNIYPRSAEFFLKEPISQARERDATKNQVFHEMPLIRETISNLKKAADIYKSVNSVDDAVLTKPNEFMHIIAASKLASATLRKEVTRLESVISEFTED